MDWRQFVMDLGPLDAAAVEAVFARHGSQAVTYSDAGEEAVLEPGPGETPLWRDTRITGLFSRDTDFDALRADLCAAFDLAQPPPHDIEELADRAWEREWLRDFRPLGFGRRLWVCPDGQRPEAGDAIVLQLDPGLAFGTGTHPTTALCLEWLDGADLAGRRVLDFGCGSGILAIAALLLGARAAHGIDIDRQALTATTANAARNGVAARLTTSLERSAPPCDVVIANILAQPLIDNAAWLTGRVAARGWLVLSGILAGQADGVRDAFARDFAFAPPATRGDWVRLAGRKAHCDSGARARVTG